MVYDWKPGSHITINAQRAGKRLEEIRDAKGKITPRDVLTEARRRSSPLHAHFEWNDGEAAEKYRLDQAGHLLGCIVTIVKRDEAGAEPMIVRAFVNVRMDNERAYTSTAVAMADPMLREQVLKDALRELELWQRRYAELEELSVIFRAAKRLGKSVQRIVRATA